MNEWVRAVSRATVAAVAALCAGCMRAPLYKEPATGGWATISFEEIPKVGMLYTFESAADCKGKQYVPHGQGLPYSQVRIPAGTAMTLWVQSDIAGSYARAEWCDAMFTFTPQPGEMYLLHAATQSSHCLYSLSDASGRPVLIQNRSTKVPISDAGSWCSSE
ncbi:MAG TPA: hypothetical protein VFA75_07000 [Nevskia sp.]|nr:hypothetical protein [Nevskia sp.]